VNLKVAQNQSRMIKIMMSEEDIINSFYIYIRK
jgi:hypothetical protein